MMRVSNLGRNYMIFQKIYFDYSIPIVVLVQVKSGWTRLELEGKWS